MRVVPLINKIFRKFLSGDYSSTTELNLQNEFPHILNYPNSKVYNTISHISAFSYNNAGDALLPLALQDTWGKSNNELAWLNRPVYPKVDDDLVHQINQTKGLIIGGGGLFLRDTNANNISGWQWPCSIEMLHKINVPIVLYAVGYNRFRGQEEFEPFFKDNITAFAEKCLYMGIRNTGSIEALKRYLPLNLYHKLRYQPCMTTFLSQLYPDQFDFDNKQDFIAFNAAFDRSHLRFNENIGNILSSTARVLKEVSKDFQLKFYTHVQTDEAFVPFLQAYGVKYEIVRLNHSHPKKIVEEYAKPNLVIGMRGHAQMIPFGCKTPIVTIVSHDKMQWFLDDIKQPEWGADVLSQSFEEDLRSRIFASLNNKQKEIDFITKKQQELFKISLDNVLDGLVAMKLN